MDDADRLRREGLFEEPALNPVIEIHARVEDEPAFRNGPVETHDPLMAPGDEPALAGVDGLVSFRTLYPVRRSATSSTKQWMVFGGMVLVAGPLAILGAVYSSIASSAGFWGLVAVVVFAPISEEILKAALPLYVAERKPWLVPAAVVLPIVALSAGLVFAVVENLLYLNVYIPNPSPEVVAWRWVFGPILHGTAAFISGLGIAKMWKVSHTELRPPDMSVAAPWLIGAVLLHGAFNVLAVVLEFTEYI